MKRQVAVLPVKAITLPADARELLLTGIQNTLDGEFFDYFERGIQVSGKLPGYRFYNSSHGNGNPQIKLESTPEEGPNRILFCAVRTISTLSREEWTVTHFKPGFPGDFYPAVRRAEEVLRVAQVEAVTEEAHSTYAHYGYPVQELPRTAGEKLIKHLTALQQKRDEPVSAEEFEEFQDPFADS